MSQPLWTEEPNLRIVLSTAPPGEAQALAQALVEAQVAACVNVMPGVRSIYRWKGTIANDPESMLVIKTSVECLPKLRAELAARHRYEVPEIAALAPIGVFTPYDDWVAESSSGSVAAPAAD